ncbi:MAG: ATP-binding cassette domain-containing protein [Bacteroidia bacterium]|nr:ATP-binding cassette domain-containing protein [Bacteroidota bacterium]MBP9083651.1 ATP-binding cassette domain-containing protein [Bacteroidia bacterium]MBK7388043.1 ATP-binding cassette domain-containing protein [Bacteroidota bacterium]MBK7969030.1 ATP-binding cassette domain-containing protein [Bacteroidota bacterium]MBK8876803.1 ATP-binding cassette domain-containing protein [Bacteroidota bacterium]
MISINGLYIGYGSHQVIIDLDWELKEGLIHGLVGLNGSGKTTLLQSICGIKKPQTGEILFRGMKISSLNISMLETEPYFYKGITGAEYLQLFSAPDTISFNTQEWLDLFSVPGDELIDNYSTGMKKKLALIGICKLSRPVMLLDEPFNGLDLESSRILTSVLKKLVSKGHTIIITSHILETLTGLCTYIHYLRNGVIANIFNADESALIDKTIFAELDAGIERRIEGIL